jgi:hypothetical protein
LHFAALKKRVVYPIWVFYSVFKSKKGQVVCGFYLRCFNYSDKVYNQDLLENKHQILKPFYSGLKI